MQESLDCDIRKGLPWRGAHFLADTSYGVLIGFLGFMGDASHHLKFAKVTKRVHRTFFIDTGLAYLGIMHELGSH